MPRATMKRTVLLSAMALALVACQDEEVAERPDPVVRVATVRLAPLAETRTYTGTVMPRTEVAEAFRVGGKVAARLVDVGDRVKAGQTLAQLDPVDLNLQLEQQRAALTAAQASLTKAQSDLERARTLFKRGHVTEAALDAQSLAVDEARSRFDQAERAVALATNQMGYAELTASADGVVSATGVEAGQVVSPGQMVVSVARLDQKEVVVSIPESRLADLEGSTAEVTLWAGDGRYAATVREIAPEANGTSRTYPVRFSVPDADENVRLGMTATVSLTKGDPSPVARIPMTAVLDDGRGPVVFVVDPPSHELKRRPVVVEAYQTENAIIAKGLEDGDKIVTLGVQKLRDGERVRLAEIQSASAD
ncbi:efflux RND transporter periplasmic adaptor subunit [Nitratireductor aquimarinus]|nr:efflux RND transporter periplasmic adaptor subunit [Nitratireductor pacificus]MBN7780430.1 efflux RND transporter periplasmic adaptor subunit [Nitratireductor pacificus]MBN7789237.1 efflux RND transporter periplasmic adaptor subunit [Nitratireductor aquimarinus]MBY6098514.1 efflux RND transporter periplasmic adaptor subunit [Nitratireductor aquimarinus]